MRLRNEDKIVETFAPMIVSATGIDNPEKLRWMSKYCHFHSLHERGGYSGYGGDLNESAVTGIQTLSMIPGMGAIRPPTAPSGLGSFWGGDTGSGDKFPSLLPLAIQVAARTIGFDIVNVVPMQGPTGVLTYLDYTYAGGKLDTTDNPMMIKINAAGTYVVGTTYWGVNEAADGSWSTSARALKLVFVGSSRIDAHPIFRIISAATNASSSWVSSTSITVAQVFTGGTCSVVPASGSDPDATIVNAKDNAVTAKAELVKALEDHVQGPGGAGQDDTATWFGDAVDGTRSIESMSRNTGENTYYRQMGLEAKTKFVAAETVQLAASVTPEMIQDLNKQFGIDVISMIENALANDISQHINKHILSRAFALGWQNNYEFAKIPGGQSLNFRVDGNTSATTASFIGKEGTSLSVAVNGFQTYGSVANYENLHTIQRRIMSKIITAGNLIAQRGRRGSANFIVTNIQMASALQDVQGFTFSPMQNTINQNNGSLYPLGTISGMTVYVDPNMTFTDNRILVGRKGGDDEPGLKFMPYLMAESIQTIAEATMSPKIAVKSRYALVEAGQHPHTQYYTIYIYTGTTTII